MFEKIKQNFFQNWFFIIFIIVFVELLPNEEHSDAMPAAKKKQEEAKCKLDQTKLVMESGMNIMVLDKQVGLKKEVDNYNKIQSDSTISCDSIKKAWDNLSELALSKSK